MNLRYFFKMSNQTRLMLEINSTTEDLSLTCQSKHNCNSNKSKNISRRHSATGTEFYEMVMKINFERV